MMFYFTKLDGEGVWCIHTKYTDHNNCDGKIIKSANVRRKKNPAPDVGRFINYLFGFPILQCPI